MSCQGLYVQLAGVLVLEHQVQLSFLSTAVLWVGVFWVISQQSPLCWTETNLWHLIVAPWFRLLSRNPCHLSALAEYE